VEIQRSVYRDDHEMFRATARRFFERVRATAGRMGCRWPGGARYLVEGRARGSALRDRTDGVWRWWRRLRSCLRSGGGVPPFERIRAKLLGPLDITAPYIVRLGTEEQKQRWLPDICRGEKILAIAMTEPGTGSDLKSIRTRPCATATSGSSTAARPSSPTG
jgi:acyl-CoA dehydrogenase